MFLFKSHKNLSHKQSSIVGFVLALMSLLVIGVLIYGFPYFGAWLNINGVHYLDLFLLAFVFTLFMSAQGLILFGFPLYYAKDKKSHMTGFKILLYAMTWMIVLVGLISAIAVTYERGQKSVDVVDTSDLEYLIDDSAVE